MPTMFSHFHQYIEACLQQGDVQAAKTSLFGALAQPELKQDAQLWLGVVGLTAQQPWLARAALASLAVASKDPATFALLSQIMPTPDGQLAAHEEAYYLAPHELPQLSRLASTLLKQQQVEPLQKLLARHAHDLRHPKTVTSLAPALIKAFGSIVGNLWWHNNQLCGWCLTEQTHQAPKLHLNVGTTQRSIILKRYQVLEGAAGTTMHAWWFTLTLDNVGDSPVNAQVAHAGKLVSLLGSPAQRTVSTTSPLDKKTHKQSATLAAPITVLVPVYEGYQETLACLHSVVESRAQNQAPFELMIINDASPHQALVEALETFAQQHAATLLHQPTNQGFINTVNRGLTHSVGQDVILLNADTLVHGDWVDRLQASAYQHANTASVTPLTNNGELMSLLGPCNPTEALTLDQLSALDNAAASANNDLDKASVAINTGCGFCLYLRHDALAELGGLDPTLTRGYGEESDWCYRAEANHWQHRGALNVVVAHQGGVSFGSEKRLRVKQNLAIIEKRYPHSSRAFDACLQQDPMREGRERVLRHWLYHQSLATLWPNTPPQTISVWPSQAHALRAAQQQGCAMALVGQTLTLRGECPHPWQLNYRLPSERQQCRKDISALGLTALTATTPAIAYALMALIPGTPTKLVNESEGTPTPLTIPAPSINTSGGLLMVLGESSSLEHPGFIQWVSQLTRQHSALYLLHTNALRANHPLASSGQLYEFSLPKLQRRQRITLLAQHLPLSGLLLMDDAPATQADARWLHQLRPLPVWKAPNVVVAPYDLPVQTLSSYPTPVTPTESQGACV